jgi:predicted nucleic acid-binding Zn ribbon protein
MKQSALARAIERELLREPSTPKHQTAKCFLCERDYLYVDTSGDDSGRFCSARCREAYDAGFPRGSDNPGLHPELMPNLYGHEGWRVVAGPPGVSIGSLYYDELMAWCERKWQRLAKRRVIEPLQPKRKCASCGSDIPNWRGTGKARRRVREDVKFCCEKCRKIGPYRRVIRPKATSAQSCIFRTDMPPLNVLGGYRFPGAPTWGRVLEEGPLSDVLDLAA